MCYLYLHCNLALNLIGANPLVGRSTSLNLKGPLVRKLIDPFEKNLCTVQYGRVQYSKLVHNSTLQCSKLLQCSIEQYGTLSYGTV